MDLNQSKLSKTEWNNTEVSVDDSEKFILSVVKNGFSDVKICENMNKSLFQIVKIEKSGNEDYMFKKYFEKLIQEMVTKYGVVSYIPLNFNMKKIKKIDIMRLDNLDEHIQAKKNEIFEFELISLCKNILKALHQKNTTFVEHLYTLVHIYRSNIPDVNAHVLEFVEKVIQHTKPRTNVSTLIKSAVDVIEKNQLITKYQNIELFDHQKKLYTIFKDPTPKLVLYIAPTGTGKTMSPIGLSEKYKIIFICVSRHVGLALAKSAISMKKKIAFAFGCETASDIRLHYFAASVYTMNHRTGRIAKVDNSVGDKVEIMICDVQSYLVAMHYMMAFNGEETIVTYWDEPTITMDYESHELHEQIHKNWKENRISKMVLSCATLPKEREITNTIMDFKMKFGGAELHTIESHDFRKSISLLNKDTKCVLPHYMFENYNEMIQCVNYCMNNMTLLRYFDLGEVVKFIEYVNDFGHVIEELKMHNYFDGIEEVHMKSLKIYYLEILKRIPQKRWRDVYNAMLSKQTYKYELTQQIRKTTSVDPSQSKPGSVFGKMNSVDSANASNTHRGLLLTTRDAFTLTSGPTIYMVQDVMKISEFYIKSSRIPPSIYENMIKKINTNGILAEKMSKLKEKIDNIKGNDDDGGDKKSGDKKKGNDKKNARREEHSPELRRLTIELDNLESQIQIMQMEQAYLPNSKEHQKVWTNTYDENAFSSRIDESMVLRIMGLTVHDKYKILLLLGIGTFDNSIGEEYLEIMKELAYSQKLYIIIASTDYIYGTNYSFCHGYIGKDLSNMTQQKIIQAMGRIGRNKLQNDYTVRFRDDDLIKLLFCPRENNLESINMNRLFYSDD